MTEKMKSLPGSKHIMVDMNKKSLVCTKCKKTESMDLSKTQLELALHGKRFMIIHQNCK